MELAKIMELVGKVQENLYLLAFLDGRCGLRVRLTDSTYRYFNSFAELEAFLLEPSKKVKDIIKMIQEADKIEITGESFFIIVKEKLVDNNYVHLSKEMRVISTGFGDLEKSVITENGIVIHHGQARQYTICPMKFGKMWLDMISKPLS
jgi:hypothetical protein